MDVARCMHDIQIEETKYRYRKTRVCCSINHFFAFELFC